MEMHRSGLLVDKGQDTTISCFCIPLFYGCIRKVLAFGIFGSEEAAEIIIQIIVLLFYCRRIASSAGDKNNAVISA